MRGYGAVVEVYDNDGQLGWRVPHRDRAAGGSASPDVVAVTCPTVGNDVRLEALVGAYVVKITGTIS